MTKELTIIGGSGHLSTRMVRLLAARGMQLKLVARNPDKVRALFGDSATVVPGDVSDPSSLHEALGGSGALYIHLNTETMEPDLPFYTEREGVQNVVTAAEANGLTHLIQIAGIGSLRPDFFHSGELATNKIRRAGMEAVRASSIPHTFLACSVFLDSLPKFAAEGSLAIFGEASNRIHFTHTDQLATHLFYIAGNPESFGKTLAVQGREGLDIEAAAERFLAGYDPAVEVVRLPMEAINGLGLPADQVAFLTHVWQVTSGMREEFVAGDVYKAFGAPELGITEFGAKLRAEISA